MGKLGLLLLNTALLGYSQSADSPATLKGVLLQQMRWTHSVKGDWFVPVSVAIAGITPEQANWKDKSGNHSIIELTSHLSFWGERNLLKLKGEQLPTFNGDNEESFRTTLTWDAAVKKLDEVLTGWEKAIEAADQAKLHKWQSTIDNIVAHEAYHTGEIVYIRREQGSWNPESGVH